MIAVAANEVRNVRDRPLREHLGIAETAGHAVVPASDPFVFCRSEFVERLVHHQKTEPVAQIQKLRVGRIVAGADGIDADFLQREETPF